jgi:hypothetical protein
MCIAEFRVAVLKFMRGEMRRIKNLLCALALFGAAVGNGNGAEAATHAKAALVAEAQAPRTALGVSALVVIALVVMLLRRQSVAG